MWPCNADGPCDCSGSPATTAAPTTATTTTSATTAAPTTATTTSQSSGSCSGVWAQCGGRSWTGPTCCASGNTCKFWHQWYSQCLPEPASTAAPTTATTTARPTSTTQSPGSCSAVWAQCGGR